LVANPTSIVADGRSTSTITLTLRDANNNLVSGQAVVFSTTQGTVSAATAGTGANAGTYTATLTSGTVAGTAIINARVGGATTNFTGVAVTLAAGAPVAAQSRLVANPTSIVSGGAGSLITLTLRDANNNPVTGQTVTFASNIGGTFSTVQANANGTYTSTFTGTTAGTASITARVGGNAFAVTAVNVTVTAGAPATAGSILTASTASIVSGGAGSLITLTLRDANNNPVTGQTVTFASNNGGTFSTVQANANGTYTSTFTGTTAGTASITARVGGNEFAVTAVNVTVTAGAPEVARSSLIFRPASLWVGDTATMFVSLFDAHNNPITGAEVYVGIRYGHSTEYVVMTDDPMSAGMYSGRVRRLHTAGSFPIFVRVNGVDIGLESILTVM
uniref:invasin domain 3-containing protein n=1 Tax=Aeromonas jandaei TaxID=650 RepID=UPI003B9F8251